MGDFNVRAIRDVRDRSLVHTQILNDIQAFEFMLTNNMFDKGPAKVGAEQEICLTDNLYRPKPAALSILEHINDDHFTNELALYNLEVNLDPVLLSKDCFSSSEKQLLHLLNKGRIVGEQFETKLLLAGILPTLKLRHLEFEYMTPIERYRTLSQKLSDMRGSEFEIYIQGVDDLIMSLPTVLFEACNTSFQLHLQIHPDEFVEKYNWSQAISGPVLSACTNSPLLFGRELWAETRIAIFKQSLDTRSSANHLRRKLSRVYFGNHWLSDSPAQLLKEQAMRFPVIVTSDHFQNSMKLLEEQKVPKLRAAMLHNGTTYTWNRLCYGHHDRNPHLRIECRYLPAGPSPIDEISNFAFWIGLMNMAPSNDEIIQSDFRASKNNFIKAARYGLDSVQEWFGKKIPANKLILEKLLPLAEAGLRKYHVNEDDIRRYLGVIAKRVETQQTGSSWIIKGYRNLQDQHKMTHSLHELNGRSIHYQIENIPVAEWEIPKQYTWVKIKSQDTLVEEVMTSDVSTIHQDHEISFAERIFKWKPFHHLPVENDQGHLVGIITDGLLQRNFSSEKNNLFFIHEIMIKDVASLKSKDTILEARRQLDEKKLTGIPVTYKQKLVGILTKKDLVSLK